MRASSGPPSPPKSAPKPTSPQLSARADSNRDDVPEEKSRSGPGRHSPSVIEHVYAVAPGEQPPRSPGLKTPSPRMMARSYGATSPVSPQANIGPEMNCAPNNVHHARFQQMRHPLQLQQPQDATGHAQRVIPIPQSQMVWAIRPNGVNIPQPPGALIPLTGPNGQTYYTLQPFVLSAGNQSPQQQPQLQKLPHNVDPAYTQTLGPQRQPGFVPVFGPPNMVPLVEPHKNTGNLNILAQTSEHELREHLATQRAQLALERRLAARMPESTMKELNVSGGIPRRLASKEIEEEYARQRREFHDALEKLNVAPYQRKDGRWVCSLCPDGAQTYQYFKHLLRHSANHLKEKPFKCPFCEHRFRRSDTARRHQSTCEKLARSVALTTPTVATGGKNPTPSH